MLEANQCVRFFCLLVVMSGPEEAWIRLVHDNICKHFLIITPNNNRKQYPISLKLFEHFAHKKNKIVV